MMTSLIWVDGRPNWASYGVILIVEWYELLYAERAMGKNVSQSSCAALTNLASVGLMGLLSLSVTPLPAGWYVVVCSLSVPRRMHSCLRSFDSKLTPWSDKIRSIIPKRQTTALKINVAVVSASNETVAAPSANLVKGVYSENYVHVSPPASCEWAHEIHTN